MQQLTETQLQEFREIFSLVDTDGGGSISKEELQRLLNTLNIKYNDEQLNMMMAEVDKDNSGNIEFDEFVELMATKTEASYTNDELIEAFKQFESDDTEHGWVRVDVLEKALTTYGANPFTSEKAWELLSNIDPDNSGRFHYSQFIKVISDKDDTHNDQDTVTTRRQRF